jgi:hypothetical protein
MRQTEKCAGFVDDWGIPHWRRIRITVEWLSAHLISIQNTSSTAIHEVMNWAFSLVLEGYNM